MKPSAAAQLALHLDSDPGVLAGSIRNDTDSRLSIGSDVWRLVWRGQLTCAVGADADLHTACGAVLDALAVDAVAREFGVGYVLGRDVGPIDPSRVNVLVDRELEWPPLECDEALRSTRDAAKGFVRIWYRAGDGWAEDQIAAPTWPEGHSTVRDWVSRLMLPRLTTKPTELALLFVGAVDDPSVHLYPSAITASERQQWAVRADGLQIGLVGSESGSLSVGKPGKDGATSTQRQQFIAVCGAETVTFAQHPDRSAGQVDVLEAAGLVQTLLTRWRPGRVPGAPLMHRGVVDEHTAEARILKGIIDLDQLELVGDDTTVARGSQFPTLWSAAAPKPRPKFLDAMMRYKSTPCAIELKVGTGGQGRYYRRSLVQAILYRHFIANAPDLDPWFDAAGLTRAHTQAMIGIPEPSKYTSAFAFRLELLRNVAARVEASVLMFDAQYAPIQPLAVDGEPPEHDREYHVWRYLAALSARWPKSFGRVIETNGAGGFYDLLSVRSYDDDTFEHPSPRPRVLINRSGSVRVYSPLGHERLHAPIWLRPLTGGDDDDDEVLALGKLGDFGKPEADPRFAVPTFPILAKTFIEHAPTGEWHWRNAWPDIGQPAWWVDRWRAVVRGVSAEPEGAHLPPLTDFWGAMIGALGSGEAAVLVHQRTLRVWAWHNRTVVEVQGADPIAKIVTAAGLVQP